MQPANPQPGLRPHSPDPRNVEMDALRKAAREHSLEDLVLDLPAELTHGCVEWFDYRNHPLEAPSDRKPS